jgi:N-acylneuraminate cytidylyltransferase
MNIAIIPARAGSKRIPGKNFRLFAGLPIIQHTINNVIASNIFDRIILSTDSADITEIAEQLGVEVPFVRPAALSDDFIGTDKVIVHAIDALGLARMDAAAICCVYPATPLLLPLDLIESEMKFHERVSHELVAVSKLRVALERTFVRVSKDTLKLSDPNTYLLRSQDFPERYYDAGQFYWGNVQTWKNKLSSLQNEISYYELPWNRAIDIDTVEDWEFCEYLYKSNLPKD